MVTQLPQEIEAKFLLENRAWIEQLTTAPSFAPGYELGGAATIDLTDTYLDTRSFQLLRHGYSLRIREQNGLRLVTLKSRSIAGNSNIVRRTEIEEPLPEQAPANAIAGWPEPVVQELLPILGGAAKLQPLCVLRQTRIKRPIIAPLGAEKRSQCSLTIGELSLDTVCVSAIANGPVLARYHVLEMELAPGVDEAELHSLMANLQPELHSKPSPQSKLEHALTVVSSYPADAPENRQGIQPTMHMAECCRLIWRQQLTAMLLNEAGVRYGADPEYVHDMRVASRRARAAARLYGDYLRPKATRRLMRDLRQTARLLGAVRDLDVAIGKLERFTRKKRNANSADLNQALQVWREQRAGAHAVLVAWLDSPRYRQFVARLAEFCSTAGAGARSFKPMPGDAPVPHQVRHVAPSMILSRFEGVRSFETIFEGDEVAVAALHLLRIECKYLRYNLEFVSNLLGPQANRLVEDLRRLQQDLGDLNDAAVSKRMAGELQGKGTMSGLQRYQDAQDKVIRTRAARAIDDLQHFVLPVNRRRLALAIANL